MDLHKIYIHSQLHWWLDFDHSWGQNIYLTISLLQHLFRLIAWFSLNNQSQADIAASEALYLEILHAQRGDWRALRQVFTLFAV